MEKINWFPGHMAKSLKEIREKQNLIDCFIVVLDSRAPLSSYNEEFDSIARNKPRVFVFSKIDSSNKNRVNEIMDKFNNENDYKICANLKNFSDGIKIFKLLKKIHKIKQEKDKKRGLLNSKLKCFVVGMPNVGKSTLINLLARQNKVKVQNQPGTTKQLQWINLNSIYLLDSPGIMIPNISEQKQGLILLATNLIKKELVSDYIFLINIFDILDKIKPKFLKNLGIIYSEKEDEKYNEIIKYAQRNNIIKKQGIVDNKRVFQILRRKIEEIKNVCWD